MATPYFTASVLLRASRSAIPYAARTIRVFPSASPRPTNSRRCQFRFSSTSPPAASKIYTFTDIQTLSSSILGGSSSLPTKTILIDTREPSELQNTGTIPGSINIPITSAPDSFFISEEEFEDRFGFQRPGKEEEVVFFCKAGVRSRAAAELAMRAGWEKVGEYPGSWGEWEGAGGKSQRVGRK